MDTKLDDWFTKTQAAGFLKVSEKTVERLATKGTVRRATRKRPSVRPSPVYCPDDLERVKAAQTAQMIVMPPQEADPGELAVPASRAGELSVFLQSLITMQTCPIDSVRLSTSACLNAVLRQAPGRPNRLAALPGEA